MIRGEFDTFGGYSEKSGKQFGGSDVISCSRGPSTCLPAPRGERDFIIPYRQCGSKDLGDNHIYVVIFHDLVFHLGDTGISSPISLSFLFSFISRARLPPSLVFQMKSSSLY